MSDDPKPITFRCDICDFENIWKYNDILQRGTILTMRDPAPTYHLYTVPCKRCNRERLLNVPVVKE